MSSKQNNKFEEISKWIEYGLTPLNTILLAIEEIEDHSRNLTKEDFYNNTELSAGPLQDALITISEQTRILKGNYHSLLQVYSEVKWTKLIKLGKAIEEGYWAFIYQLVWRFVSSDIKILKSAVLELMDLTENQPAPS